MVTAQNRLNAYPARVKLMLGVDTIAFLIGMSTHLVAILKGWWFPHHPFLNAYWASLTLLDPLAVVLLYRAPRSGLLLALAIMLSDVAINSVATSLYADAGMPYAVDYRVQLQTAFLGFLLGSAPFLWPYFAGEKVA